MIIAQCHHLSSLFSRTIHGRWSIVILSESCFAGEVEGSQALWDASTFRSPERQFASQEAFLKTSSEVAEWSLRTVVFLLGLVETKSRSYFKGIAQVVVVHSKSQCAIPFLDSFLSCSSSSDGGPERSRVNSTSRTGLLRGGRQLISCATSVALRSRGARQLLMFRWRC